MFVLLIKLASTLEQEIYYFHKMKYRLFTFMLLMVISILYPSSCFCQQLRVEAKNAYQRGALFKAKQLCEQKLNTLEEVDSLNPFERSEAYQLYANINYAIGLPEQYKEAIDSMWHYRSKLNQPIYFVEYAAYQLRYLTYFHNYAPAIKLVDTASQVLSRHQASAHLIDTLFFHANVLNAYRNTFMEDLSDSEKQMRKWTLFKEYEKLPWFNGSDAVKKAVYCTFLGNIMQDFVYLRPDKYPKEISDTALQKALYYYKKGRKFILQKYGRENHLSGRLAALIALQYAKDEYQVDSVFFWCNKAIKASQMIKPNGRETYRNLKYPLFAARLKAEILTKDPTTLAAQVKSQIKEVESMLSHRSYFISKFLQNRSDRFAQGYALDPTDQLTLLYRQNLIAAKNYADSLACFRKIWRFQSVRYSKATYFEALQNHLGKQNVQDLILAYHSIYEQNQILLDELFLSRNNELDKDTLEVKKEIAHWQKKLNYFLANCPIEFKNFIENKSQQTLEEFQRSLDKKQAFVLFYYSRGMLFIPGYKPFALLVSNATVQLVDLKESYETIAFPFSVSSLKNGAQFKRQAYLQYHNFFEEIDQALDSTISSLSLSVTPQFSSISFESTLKDTAFYNWKEAPFLLKERAIAYTQNQSVDFLNSFRSYSSKRKLYQDQCDSTALIATPFALELAKKLVKKYSFESLISSSNILADSSYLAFQLISHASLDSLLKVHHHYYKAQAKYDENAILFCDTTLNLSDFDGSDLKAKLAVIASCGSGEGFVEVQNGRYDYARVMLKNGSQTAITSFIEMDEKSTAQILEKFYAYLSNGEKVAAALQKAKLDFLAQVKDPELYNPVYWAGLKVDGANQKIHLLGEEEENSQWILAIIMLGIGILIVANGKDCFS